MSGEAPELDEVVKRDERLKTLKWYPQIFNILGKQWFREGTLAKRAYTCEDS